ncbi:MAG TPA: TIR domain-containing protein [Pyrinomonadaceae bacterium]|jgi:hypothetical protein
MSDEKIQENLEDLEFDIALSFAGEDRRVAETLTNLLIEQGIRVFYDLHTQAELWGKDLYQHLQLIYRDKARYCIILVSKDYAKKLWTRHELRQAQARAFRESSEYILPIRLDDTEIPGLNNTIGYIDLRVTDLNTICKLVIEKLNFENSVKAETGSSNQEVPKSNVEKKVAFGKSIVTFIKRIATTKVHRLLVFWIQLTLSHFMFSAIGGIWVGSILVNSMVLIFPLSIAISRLVNRNIVMSILVGGLVIGMLEGALAYSIRDWAANAGILYGAFYGASLTRYFSDDEKQTTLFWAVISTSFLIAVLVIVQCSVYDVLLCFDLVTYGIGDALIGAAWVIILGLVISLALIPLTRLLVELIADIYRNR